MEVAPGIHRIETSLGDRLNCLYLLVGDEHILLIDTGLAATPYESLVPYLDSIGVDPRHIDYVVITHADFDHMGGNAALRKLAPDALFLCHELDRQQVENVDLMIKERYGEFSDEHDIDESNDSKVWIRANAQGVPIDMALAGGERIHLGSGWFVDVLHTPGHSRGHLSIYDPRSRSAIITDTALWHGLVTKDGKPAFPPTYRYLDTYLASIQRLQGMSIAYLLTSHYPVYSGSAIAEFLAESRTYADRVDSALRDELMRSGREYTMRELIDVLGPQLGEWADNTFLVYPFQGHLERLISYRQVIAGKRDNYTTYRWQQDA